MMKLSLAVHGDHAKVQEALVQELKKRGGIIKRGPAPRGNLERAAQQLLDEFEGNNKSKSKGSGKSGK